MECGSKEQFLYDGRKERVGAPDKFFPTFFLRCISLDKIMERHEIELYYRPCPNNPFDYEQIVVTSQDIFG